MVLDWGWDGMDNGRWEVEEEEEEGEGYAECGGGRRGVYIWR